MKIFFLVFFTLINLKLSAQTYHIIYEQRNSMDAIVFPDSLNYYKDITDCTQYNVRMFEYLVNKSSSSYRFKDSYIDNVQCHEAFSGMYPGETEIYFMNLDSMKAYRNSLKLMREDEFIVFDLNKEFAQLDKDDNLKTICNHICRGITVKDRQGKKFKIFYATDIYIQGGPERFGGMPGMVLSIQDLEGKKTITATSVVKIYDQEIILPSLENIMTFDDFKLKMDERFKGKVLNRGN